MLKILGNYSIFYSFLKCPFYIFIYKNIMNWILIFLSDYYLLIFTSIISFLLFNFVMEGFKFSKNKIIKFLEIILIISLLYIIVQTILFTFNIGVVYASELSPEDAAKIKDLINNKDINMTTNVVIDAQGAQVISQGMKNAAGQIGLGAAIGGVSAAVGTAIKGTAMPVSLKCGCIIGAGLAGGLIHTCTTALSRTLANRASTSTIQSSINAGTGSLSDKAAGASEQFRDLNSGGSFNSDWISQLLSDNPAEVALYSFYGINLICIMLVFFLSILLFSKYLVNKELKLNIIDKLISEPYNKKVKNNILKVIVLYSKTNNLYIILCIATLLVCLLFSNYFIITIINNFDTFCKVYLNL